MVFPVLMLFTDHNQLCAAPAEYGSARDRCTAPRRGTEAQLVALPMKTPDRVPDAILERAITWSATHRLFGSLRNPLRLQQRAAPLRVCEVNSRTVQHTVLCQRYGRNCEFVGISFVREVQHLESQLRAALPGHPLVLLAPGGAAVYSVRLALGVRTPNTLSVQRSCGVLVLRMDAPTAAARQTLISDMTAALQLISDAGPMVLIMTGALCGRPEAYLAARNTTQFEQCWREAAWEKLVVRGDVVEPLCVSSDGWSWCIGRLDLASVCRANQPALLEEASHASATLTQPRCNVRHEQVAFHNRLIAPEWKLEGTLLKLSTDSDVSGDGTGSSTLPMYDTITRSATTMPGRIRRSYRYYSLLRCGTRKNVRRRARNESSWQGELCLLFKNSVYENWVGRVTSTDGGRSFWDPQLVLPVQTRNNSHLLPATMTHNTAFAHIDGGSRIAIVGGRFLSHHRWVEHPAHPYGGGRAGVWMAVGDQLLWGDRAQPPPRYAGKGKYFVDSPPASTQWRDFRLLFDGMQAGCVERRPRPLKRPDGSSACEFDGRLSLVEFNGELLIFARANLGASGLRFVQLTRSSDRGRSWSRFNLIKVRGMAPASSELYFFAVQANPVHNSSLLALVPIVHRLGACIGLTLSVDAINWSPIVPLLRCPAFGERSSHHPVAGGLVRIGRKKLALFVHEDVPEIWFDQNTPAVLKRALQKQMRKAALKSSKVGLDREDAGKAGMALRPPALSRLVRITFGCERLASWTSDALQTLHRRQRAHALDRGSCYRCSLPNARCVR